MKKKQINEDELLEKIGDRICQLLQEKIDSVDLQVKVIMAALKYLQTRQKGSDEWGKFFEDEESV